MWFSPRLTDKRLAELCHRLAVSLAAGVDLRRAWQRETNAAPRSCQAAFAQVQAGIQVGDSFGESLAQTGVLFPRLFREMVPIGERAGQIAEVLHSLADHYQVRHDLRRTFWGLVAWPLLQLGMAVAVVGLLIFILGALDARTLDGQPIDLLGLGFIGTPGLIVYGAIVGSAAAVVALLIALARRGALWVAPIQRHMTRLPGLGSALQKIGLARISWTLHLLLNVEMDLRQVIPLVLGSTGNAFYTQHERQMVAGIARGEPMYLAFAHARAFPPPFLDALAVAEESGQICESMARLSQQYQQEAESAMKWIANFAGIAIGMAVGGGIVMMIFRLFTVLYLDPLNQAAGL